jgi:hypothetical protein
VKTRAREGEALITSGHHHEQRSAHDREQLAILRHRQLIVTTVAWSQLVDQERRLADHPLSTWKIWAKLSSRFSSVIEDALGEIIRGGTLQRKYSGNIPEITVGNCTVPVPESSPLLFLPQGVMENLFLVPE